MVTGVYCLIHIFGGVLGVGVARGYSRICWPSITCSVTRKGKAMFKMGVLRRWNTNQPCAGLVRYLLLLLFGPENRRELSHAYKAPARFSKLISRLSRADLVDTSRCGRGISIDGVKIKLLM